MGIAANRAMDAFGAEVLQDDDTLLTHWIAWFLATCGFCTALGRYLKRHGTGQTHSRAGEIKMVFQGVRLTDFKLRSGACVTMPAS